MMIFSSCFRLFILIHALSRTFIYASLPLWLISISRDIFSNVFRNNYHYDNNIWKDNLNNYNKDHTILITGSSGGIGKELTNLYNSLGNNLILHSSRNGTKNDTIYLNFNKLESLSNIVSIKSRRIDTIIHNAGLMNSNSSIRNIHCVNCIAPFVITLFLLPSLFYSNQPKIIFIGSSSHLRSKPYQSGDIHKYLKDISRKKSFIDNSKLTLNAYAQSKYNLMLLSIALQQRLQLCNITIHTIHPGLVDTPMLKSFFGTLPFIGRNKLFLTPKESAIHILNGIYNVPPTNNYAIPSYIIRGKSNKYLMSRRFINKPTDKLLQQANICYYEIINILPLNIRTSIINTLEYNCQRLAKTSSTEIHVNAQILALHSFIKDLSI